MLTIEQILAGAAVPASTNEKLLKQTARAAASANRQQKKRQRRKDTLAKLVSLEVDYRLAYECANGQPEILSSEKIAVPVVCLSRAKQDCLRYSIQEATIKGIHAFLTNEPAPTYRHVFLASDAYSSFGRNSDNDVITPVQSRWRYAGVRSEKSWAMKEVDPTAPEKGQRQMGVILRNTLDERAQDWVSHRDKAESAPYRAAHADATRQERSDAEWQDELARMKMI